MAIQIKKGECALCVNCCGVDFHVSEGRLVKVEGTKGHPVNDGRLCPRGQQLVNYEYSADRILHPMKREGSVWRRISWDQAYDEIAAKLMEIKEKYGAKTVAFFCGSIAVERMELAGLTHRFRAVYGSPNFFSVESGCYVARIVSRAMTFGNLYEHDQVYPKLMILWGHNPHASRFPMIKSINEALENGMRLIVIDPRRIPFASEGTYLQIRPGTDAALALAMMNVIIEEDLYDKEFVRDWTNGFDKLAEHVKAYPPEKVEGITGISASDIRYVARLFATTKPASIIQAVGSLDRQINNMHNTQALAILQSITGNINVPGGWLDCALFPTTDLRLQSILADEPIGHDVYPMFYRRDWGGRGAAPYGSVAVALDTLHTDQPYKLRGFFNSAGNPAVQIQQSKRFAEGVKKLELKVCLELTMTQTAELCDYVLPTATFMEQTGVGAWPTVAIHGAPIVAYRPRVIEPLGECKADWEIWSDLARRIGCGEYFPWKTDEEVTDYILQSCGVPLEELKKKGGSGIEFRGSVYGIHKEKKFYTKSGKIELYQEIFAKHGFEPLPVHVEPSQSPISTPELAKEYPLMLLTGVRIMEYINAGFRNFPEIRRLRPDPQVEIHPAAAAKYGITDDQWVWVETKDGKEKYKAYVTKDIHPEVVGTHVGWASANCNDLLDGKARDPICGYIQDKPLLCRVRPA